jgi:hypothetical protein
MPSSSPKADPYIIYGRGGAGNIRTSLFSLNPSLTLTYPRPPLHNPQRLEVDQKLSFDLPTTHPLRLSRQLLRRMEREIRGSLQEAP